MMTARKTTESHASNRDEDSDEELLRQSERIQHPMGRGILPLKHAARLGTDMELRCDNKLFGILDENTLEVRCDSRWCGKRPGVVVVHRFNTITGELIETLRYKNPKRPERK